MIGECVDTLRLSHFTDLFVSHAKGVLNGWPSLRCFELVALEGRRGSSSSLTLPSAKEILSGQIMWRKVWHIDEEGSDGIEPSLPEGHQVCRATLRGPSWSSIGWSAESPGFVFWFESQRPEGPRLSYGTNMLKMLGDEKCTMIHMVSHRYAVNRAESPRDRITYHSVCFLEWDHGKYGTVVEGAYLNGIVSLRVVLALDCQSWCDANFSSVRREDTRARAIGVQTRTTLSQRCTRPCLRKWCALG